MRDLLATIMKCLRRSLGLQRPSSKPSPLTPDESDLKPRSLNGTDYAYKTLDMPPQTSDLEWVTTADLACEILRRCDVGVLTIGKQRTDQSYTIEVYCRGSFIHKMMVIRQTQEFLVDVEVDE